MPSSSKASDVACRLPKRRRHGLPRCERSMPEPKVSEPKVAVIVFPGTNSETETVDACQDAGMDAELFWWSEDPERLRGFDAYVIAGGFAHEDRVRAGAIAAKSPVVS